MRGPHEPLLPRRVVCVGGDGMFSEVLHGLLGRTQRMAGVDQNQPRAALVPCPLRIGIIPAGGAAALPHPCPSRAHALGPLSTRGTDPRTPRQSLLETQGLAASPVGEGSSRYTG